MHVSDLSSNHQKYSQSSILSFVLTFIHPVILPLSIHLGHMVWVMPGIVVWDLPTWRTSSSQNSLYLPNYLPLHLLLHWPLYTTFDTQHFWRSPVCRQNAHSLQRSPAARFLRVRCATRHFFNADTLSHHLWKLLGPYHVRLFQRLPPGCQQLPGSQHGFLDLSFHPILDHHGHVHRCLPRSRHLSYCWSSRWTPTRLQPAAFLELLRLLDFLFLSGLL